MAPYRIELRSDTQTVPTADMREAMAQADVGDEQWGEDPTVLELERTSAEMFGREAGLFVPSGTMGNLTSMLASTERGDTVIVDGLSHMVGENGNYAVVAGCTLLPVETDGVLDADLVRERLESSTIPPARPALLWTENTHNVRGGVSWGPEVMQDIVEFAAERDMRVHVDGARIFNAAVDQGVSVRELTAGADTVQFCLSKGLGAPFGSMVVGSGEMIGRVARYKKMLGGAMRQAGVMAAAGLIALRDGPARLAADHANALRLGELLGAITGLDLIYPAATNMVFVRVDPTLIDQQRFVAAARAQGVGVADIRPGHRLRFVTHHQIDAQDIEEAGQILRDAAEAAAVQAPAGAIG